ncbi:MAG TPA: EAL domain-containing protein, partial [Geminicoccaceae bacterium]
SEGGWPTRAAGVVLLAAAVGVHHIVGVAAVTIVADPTIALSENATLTRWLVIAITAIGACMMLLACVALLVDKLDRQHAAVEGERMRGLANAAVEGLLVCRDTTIVTANTSFAALSGRAAESLDGTALALLIPDEAIRATLLGVPGEAVETTLLHGDGSRVAVALVLRPIDFGGGLHNAIAVRDLRDRKKAEEDIQFLAHHDALTGLPNRATFTRTLDAVIADAGAGARLGVLCLGLDRFKETNDLFGHAAGDDLLRAVARCIGGVLGDRQTLARLGGDEFAIVAPGLAGLGGAVDLAERVLQALRDESAKSMSGPLAASVGIALWPEHARDTATLLGHADTALYRAKADGRGLWRVFDPAMGAEVRDRRMIEHDLRHAVERDELHLVYQPQTSIESGEVVGFEALLRWQHPTRGKVPPDHFIRIAEETGSIAAIGEWVLRAACREAASWTQPLRIAINVSAVQIHSPGFPQLVHEVLLQTGLSPDRLELEITETALIRDFDRGLATLRLLKALGVRIAMD